MRDEATMGRIRAAIDEMVYSVTAEAQDRATTELRAERDALKAEVARLKQPAPVVPNDYAPKFVPMDVRRALDNYGTACLNGNSHRAEWHALMQLLDKAYAPAPAGIDHAPVVVLAEHLAYIRALAETSVKYAGKCDVGESARALVARLDGGR